MNKILIVTPDSKQISHLVEKLELPDLDIVFCDAVEDALKLVEDCNIVLGSPALIATILPCAKCLEWAQSSFAGVDILCAGNLRTDYLLTGVKNIFGPLISEYVFAYVLALERGLFETRECQKTATWQELPYRSLKGITMGICGMGSIGNHIAQSAQHFGMRVLGFKRTEEDNPNVEQMYTHNSFGDFLGQLDYLVNTLPGTSETEHLIDHDALQQMKPGSVLINVGRGSAIVEEDLVGALQKGLIRAAVLDVFKEEPLSPKSPLWKMTNVFVTPHNAAVTFPEDIASIFASNYTRFVEKRPLEYVIDFERGY